MSAENLTTRLELKTVLPRPQARGAHVTAVKWLASAAQIGGYTLTGIGWTPWNIPLFLIGVLGWLAIGVMWRDKALVLLHIVALAALIAGLVTQ